MCFQAFYRLISFGEFLKVFQILENNRKRVKTVYNSLTFETPSNSLSSSLSLRGAKNEALDTFVIVSLNAKAFRRGNLLFLESDCDTLH
jgi:hypothetical protein